MIGPVVMFPPRAGMTANTLVELQNEFPEVREVFETLSGFIGVCLDCDSEKLRDCVGDGFCGQLIEHAAAVGMYRTLERAGVRPGAIAVHCLGVYSALSASGCVPLQGGFELLSGHIESVLARPGELLAVLHVPVEETEAACARIAGTEVSTYNGPSLCTVSGTTEALQEVTAFVRQRGGKARSLRGFGAWHYSGSRSLAPALRALAETYVVADATLPLYFPFATPRSVAQRNEVIDAVVQQAVEPVRWHPFVKSLLAGSDITCVEVGPARVLSAFHKSDDPLRGRILNFRNQSELQRVVRRLSTEIVDSGWRDIRPSSL